jgi:DnaJ-class molecular chaperone
MNCSRCNGYGAIGKKTCSSCGGSGRRPGTDSLNPLNFCHTCHGAKTVPVMCPDCRGTGKTV